ncbi:MAG: DegV family protein [Lachnospiraceae bacterium]
MGKYVIMTDSSCDLSEEYIKEHGLDVLNLLYNMDGTIYGEDKTMDIKEFYAKMRGGSMPTTMAVNPEDVANAMRRHLEQGEDILYIAFSSGLSASCQNAVLGANDVRDEFPDRKIIVVDSLCRPWDRDCLSIMP